VIITFDRGPDKDIKMALNLEVGWYLRCDLTKGRSGEGKDSTEKLHWYGLVLLEKFSGRNPSGKSPPSSQIDIPFLFAVPSLTGRCL